MARNYGTVHAGIWRDEAFRSLSCSAQRLYLLLITQADISSAGTLPLTLRRWSAYATDTSSDALSDALSELAKLRFVIVDEDTEELLVRKFVKWDGGHANEKRQHAIRSAANAVTSPQIRAALAVELDMLGVPHGLSDTPPDTASDRPPDTPRVVVTEVVPTPNPQPSTRNPVPPASTDVAAPSTNGHKRPRQPDPIWDAVMAACGVDTGGITDTARGAYNKAVKDLRAAGATPGQITRRAHVAEQRWKTGMLNPTALARRWSELEPAASAPRDVYHEG